MSIPRPEYPRPQLVREEWINLNGEWEFEIDSSRSGKDREFFLRPSLNQKITVPFCPESLLSGIGNTDFMECVWYRRTFELPKEWEGKRVLLHFGAVDDTATVYVNGKPAGTHRGGYTSFSIEITDFLQPGENTITLCAEDFGRSGAQPSGKQSDRLDSYQCYYTRVTGIWQTVWLEAVSDCYITTIHAVADIHQPSANLSLTLTGDVIGCKVSATAYFEGRRVGSCETVLHGTSAKLSLPLTETHLWEVGCGNLYDVDLTLSKDGIVTDSVKTYFGLREVSLEDGAFLLNGKKVFGRWVLDQGYYPDGIYTAPDDDAFRTDIESAMQLGFNGARLHEKVFEERFLYWADRMGYMVWGEYGNWGLDHSIPANIYNILPQWMEAVRRDFSHPSLIGWCPFNETWDYNGSPQYNELIGLVYDVTKTLDPTRPVIDTSGNYHVRTDIFDVHDYLQDPKEFATMYENTAEGEVHDQIWRFAGKRHRQTYGGEPLFMSEYGGIQWNVNSPKDSWGYGDAPKTPEEFIERYRGLTEAIMQNKSFLGFCYTQLYDVEQECNGLMTYDRTFKFDPRIFYEINTQKAAIEE